jgi:hypothetical protein
MAEIPKIKNEMVNIETEMTPQVQKRNEKEKVNEREKRESERKGERRKGTEGRMKGRKGKWNERTEWMKKKIK